MFEKKLNQPEIDCRERNCLMEVPENLRCSFVHSYRAKTSKQECILNAVKKYVDDFKNMKLRSLVFYGSSNTAKSHLSVAIYRQIVPLLIRRDSEGSCPSDIHDRAQTMQNHFWIRGDQAKDVLCPKLDSPGKYTAFHLQIALFGVLDDIDKFPSGNWASALYGLIDDRTASRLPTVISMNSTPKEFAERYGKSGQAIISRLKRNGGIFIKTS